MFSLHLTKWLVWPAQNSDLPLRQCPSAFSRAAPFEHVLSCVLLASARLFARPFHHLFAIHGHLMAEVLCQSLLVFCVGECLLVLQAAGPGFANDPIWAESFQSIASLSLLWITIQRFWNSWFNSGDGSKQMSVICFDSTQDSKEKRLWMGSWFSY